MGKRRKMTKAGLRAMRKYRAEIRKRIRAKGPCRDLPPLFKPRARRLRQQLGYVDRILYFHDMNPFIRDVLIRECVECVEQLAILLYASIRDAGIGFKDGEPYSLVDTTKKKEPAHA